MSFLTSHCRNGVDTSQLQNGHWIHVWVLKEDPNRQNTDALLASPVILKKSPSQVSTDE